jgi:hypothetical protein
VFKELQITLYDVFGYLIPGAIILVALILLFWTLFWPSVPLRVWTHPPLVLVICVALGAYLAGHLGQAVGNLLETLPKVSRTLEKELPLSAELSELVRNAVAAQFGEKAGHLRPKELLMLCDQALVHVGSPGEREIFVYREGFYRGASVALAFLSLMLILRLVWTPAIFVLTSRTVQFYRWELGLAAILAAIGSWLGFRRYLRFACHKNITCAARFLALAAKLSAK